MPKTNKVSIETRRYTGYNPVTRLVDIHSHVYEFEEKELRSILDKLKDIVIVGVSDDLESAERLISLASRFDQIVPCLGLHPWSVKNREESISEAYRIIELAINNNIKCFGEIGLDTKFVPETIEAQRQVFRIFLEVARDNNMFVNLHTAGTWEEVFNLLVKYDVAAANLHWYTGPLSLLKDIEAQGFTISINPAIKIQRKHQEVVRKAPLEIMLTESDSPYEYRGMRLTPLMITDVLEKIAMIKEVDVEYVKQVVWDNFRKKYLYYFKDWIG